MKNDGGSAFPQTETEYSRDEHAYTGNVHSTGGMSLRDYFAGQALQGFLAALPHMKNPTNERGEKITEETVARQMYEFADAMIAERSRS